MNSQVFGVGKFKYGKKTFKGAKGIATATKIPWLPGKFKIQVTPLYLRKIYRFLDKN